MAIMIPQQLKQKGIYFVLLEKEGKKPFERSWQKKRICYDSEDLKKHLDDNGNYGIMGGGVKKLVIVDFDNEKVQEDALKKLPETFTVKTGSGMLHKYYYSDNDKSFKIFDEDINTLADIQGEGKQVVGPNSIHPNKNKYLIVEDKPISFIPYSELKAIMMSYDRKPKKEDLIKIDTPKIYEENFMDTLMNSVRVPDVLSNIGIDTSKNPTECPFHSSKGGKCLGFNNETWHCFHCDESGNILSLIKKHKNCGAKESIEYLADLGGLNQELEESRERYKQKVKEESYDKKREIKNEFIELISGKEKKWNEATEILRDYVMDKLTLYTTKEDLKSEMWVYKNGVYVPQGRSEVKIILRDILEDWYSAYIYGKILEKIEPDTFIESNAFFRTSHLYEIPVENGILNIQTLELKPFDPKQIFFNKLPITFDPSKECKEIDKFLKQVLSNEEDINVFYEMCGFCLLGEYRYEKAFMFVGVGRNGKGKSIELLKRLVGMENCASIPLGSLIPESFAISELFGKRINLAGDIGNADFKDTSTFKGLTGRDLIGGKRKYLPNIYFQNYAKMIFACNELPMVYDLTKGFWDRWILLEFPYTFVTQEEYDSEKDKEFLKIRDDTIIEKISTPNEMSGLLNQAILGLHNLFNAKKFSTNKGSEEVKSTWIRKSNSFMAFCWDNIEEDTEGKINKKDIRKKYAVFCKQHKVPSKSDIIIKNVLQQTYGASEQDVNINPGGYQYERFWFGIKWK